MVSLIGDCTSSMLGYVKCALLVVSKPLRVVTTVRKRYDHSFPRYVSMCACYFPAELYYCGYREEGTHIKMSYFYTPVNPPLPNPRASILHPLKQTPHPSLMRSESTYLLKWETPKESNISYVHGNYQLYETLKGFWMPAFPMSNQGWIMNPWKT